MSARVRRREHQQNPTQARLLTVAILLLLTIAAVFWRVGGHAFLSYDDPDYVTENPHVREGITLEGLVWAFTTSHAANWHPLTWVSHMLDVQLFGMDPGAHHLVNLAIHCANAILLFLLLHSMTGSIWRSAFVAAVFALHPLRAESVAWVSERKDVLSALFWFLTLLAYVRYARKPDWKRMALVGSLLTLGLLAKQMLVTLPFVLLLLDYWPLRRWPVTGGMRTREAGSESTGSASLRTAVSLVKEKIPLFALAAGFSVTVFLVQRSGGAMASTDYFPFGIRVGNAIVSYLTYIRKLFWPSDLAIFYPHPGESLAVSIVAGAAFLLLLLSWLALREARRTPAFFVGWFWYLGTLVPVIGLVQVGIQAMADRYTYIPVIGLTLALAWTVPEVLTGKLNRALAPLAVTIIAVLSFLTWQQAGYWKDNKIVFAQALEVTENNFLAHNDLGSALEKEGRMDEALRHYRESLRISPDFVYAKTNLAALLGRQGDLEKATTLLREVLEVNPAYANAHNNLGIIAALTGRQQEAMTSFSEAIRLNPHHVDARYNRGVLLSSFGRWEEAIRDFREALRIKPDHQACTEALKYALAQVRE